MKKGYIRGDLMRIVRNLFLVSLMAYSSMFAADLETETKSEKKSSKKFYKLHKNHGLKTEAKNDKKLYDFTKNSALEGIDLEKSPSLKSHKKSDKKFYKQLPKNRISEGMSMPIIDFNKTLSFGPYFERTKSKKTQYMDGGLMMHIRF
ncbi:hypothetical protein I6764_04225 [Helicobacter pylori]|uniref:hypothetical protein n=1 Tax=Helicobacter pylori TaxID=210 RepID=UPI0009A3184B|nr:hypothetical protein [Helicobacter pylori]MBH0273596.1 hypothetical protein [Helicobacter pylori]NHA17128.1 hypothetical protein [Helicobacter pylori]NHA22023.1 hypothetical protein [Helicobacter pylori]NHA53931.1 hypothetical protein [Helicobacter pylori]WRC42291.1 hypothetical protein E5L15_02955 [Helicobacter pylori]